MISTCSPAFWTSYNALPEDIRTLAHKNFLLWKENPQHPSLRFKHLGDGVWSVRIGIHYRALGEAQNDGVCWFWIGHHSEYDRLVG